MNIRRRAEQLDILLYSPFSIPPNGSLTKRKRPFLHHRSVDKVLLRKRQLGRGLRLAEHAVRFDSLKQPSS